MKGRKENTPTQKSTTNSYPIPPSINPITISKIRKRFRAASYTFGGANWDKVFGQFDTSGDGALDAEEFFLAVRAGLKIPPREVTDRDVEIILKALDIQQIRV